MTVSELKQQNRQSAIKGTEDIMVSYANCCKPLPGDSIVAHTSPGKGLVVHTQQCHNVAGFENELDKYIPIQWNMEYMNQYEYSSDLNIMLVNHKAGLAQLFNIIAKSNANVIDIHTKELPDLVYSINLTVVVLNRVHLSKVIRHIKKLSNVKSVKRINQKNITKRN